MRAFVLRVERIERQGILGRQQACAAGWMSRAPPILCTSNPRHGVREQRRIAANLLTMKPPIRAASSGQSPPGPDQAGDHAARSMSPMSTTGTRQRCKAHVGDVVCAQVHFARAAAPSISTMSASPLRRAKLSSTNGSKSGFIRCRRGLGGAMDAAVHDHLGADLALRLEQNGIHVHARGMRAARACSAWARPISPRPRHGGVVGHVLRLERTHPQADRRMPAPSRRRSATATRSPCPGT